MSDGKLNVLVYNGSGVSASSRDHALFALRSFLSHRYDVQLVSPKSLRQEPWQESCALLIFPGGRDIPYQFDLEGQANKRIRDWVQAGGRYLGFCAGAYYASKTVQFELGTPLEVTGERELCFFPGVCRGTVFPGFAYETEAGAREVVLELDRSAWRDHWSQSPDQVEVWYNGGGAFVMNDQATAAGVSVLARYSQAEGKPVAGVLTRPGKGKAALWAAHPEHPTFMGSPSAEKERLRRGLLRSTLALLDLDVSDEPAPPPQLLPLFLSSPNTDLINSTAASLAGKAKDVEGGSIHLDDRNDCFALYPSSSIVDLFAKSRTRPGSSDVEILRTTVKDIAICTEGLPLRSHTPLFDLAKYYEELAIAASTPSPTFGNIVLYGEAVTSTQTMLDKNEQFLSTLPSGLVCLASHQIAGRGRGGNSWVSPAGCLQFSLVLRLGSQNAPKIVFLQYLFGLAVVEAIRGTKGYEEVGVKLKWPNDIYGEVGGEGEGMQRYRKIGGILVNSSYAGDDFTLVVGCGVNTSNPKPTTSVNELIALHNARTGANLAPFRPETLLALILAQFGGMWDTFIAEGFQPFVDRYLESWIHSDQRVTIESTGQVVKIVGITPEHGLLRTLPVDVDRNGREVYGGGMGIKKFVDLQPDGNGFDMLKSLLVAR
ncbi:biotin-protein ligase [Leucosporidium creatinivorum]|uniref:Biotin-protein ligase n=1 Tax=Leucosporidium creatinivorum TaxID=106004 RepID=A0A1Y2G3D9_9BASI|nr:biotin-protein ligase [Leucosporidium creatinivorum]